MSFLQNFKQGAKIVSTRIQTKIFWVNFTKVALPFFITVTLFSLFLNSSSDILEGEFAKVNETNFGNQKWKSFWGIKILISFIYGMWVTNKKMK